MIRRPPRSTRVRSSAASDVYKRQPDSNPRLRLAIANAKGASMPKDNIQRAISKGADKDSASFIECTFEGYANGGVAIFLESTTDNQQRTIANVRSYFNKNNGSLGTNGSLSFI